MTNNQPEIMTIGETAQYLRISLSSLYKIAQDGKIPCQKVGRHWRFRRQTIDRWLDAYPTGDGSAFARLGSQTDITTKLDNTEQAVD